VIIPMIAVGGVLLLLVDNGEQGRERQRLVQGRIAAAGLFRDEQRRAQEAARVMAGDEALAVAIRSRQRDAIRGRLEALLTRTRSRRARLEIPGLAPVDVGGGEGVAPARANLVGSRGRLLGHLTVSVAGPQEYAALVKRVADVQTGVWGEAGRLAGTLPGLGAQPPPAGGEVEIGPRSYLVDGFSAPAFAGARVQVRVLSDATAATGLSAARWLVLAGLAGFLVLALTFAWAVWRSLRQETGRLLAAAQELGRGDFAVDVSAEGNDEFAALGREFNSMARQLQGRLEELQRERARLQEAVRRVGESFAAGLDRDALLEIVVQTAVDGVGAACGRASLREDGVGRLDVAASTGPVSDYDEAIGAAEAAVLRQGGPAEVSVNGASALAHALRAADGDRHLLGMISVARSDRPFSEPERALFQYLSNQAAVSIENVELHETVQRQAMTDDLTGLFNHRRFQEVVAGEVERARRFGQDMGLIMLDIDDFKLVNDTYGHLQGDLVLREVARALRDSSREIDEPARYGGEEMAVALPQTDLEGAYQFAERVRKRIEGLELPLLERPGKLRVTASLGVAALSGANGADKDALVAAADAALYEAKRAGKNRTVKAE
jgi:diguanylate cyclase (GGDEF)-like protein